MIKWMIIKCGESAVLFPCCSFVMSRRNGGVGRDSEITADTCLAGTTWSTFFESFAVS